MYSGSKEGVRGVQCPSKKEVTNGVSVPSIGITYHYVDILSSKGVSGDLQDMGTSAHVKTVRIRFLPSRLRRRMHNSTFVERGFEVLFQTQLSKNFTLPKE